MTPNVLHISTVDNAGGSAKAAYRLHVGLRDAGAWSRMLVRKKYSGDPHVQLIRSRKFLHNADSVFDRIFDRMGLEYLFYPSSFALVRRVWFRRADVIQLFNIHGNYFSFTALPLLSRLRPVVWRLDDMWALTGHTSYSYDCERWRTGCGECPYLAEDVFPLRRDTTAQLWKLKRKVYERSQLTIVAPSKWLAQLAQESPLLGRFPVHVIPYGLDIRQYRPVPKAMARQVLGLDPDKPTILFTAGDLNQKRKGAIYFREAVNILARSHNEKTCLLLVGGGAMDWKAPESFEVRNLGSLEDDLHLMLAYSAADIFVLPSLADNLPNTMLESMACGTPVVAFNVGGIPDAVRHMATGYLAAPQDAADLAQGIKTLLSNPDLCRNLAERARKTVEQEYNQELQAERYLRLYAEVIGQHESAQARPNSSLRSWIESPI